MPSNVTTRQLFFILSVTLTTYSMINISKVMAQDVGPMAWVPLILTTIVFALFTIIIIHLQLVFEGRKLSDYSRDIIGLVPAYVISLFYFVYFLIVSVYINLQLTTLLKTEFFPKTPEWFTLLLGTSVFSCLAYKGVTNVARFFEIIGIVYLITTIALHVAMITQGKVNNILPFFQAQEVTKYATSFKDGIFFFLGIEVLTFIPFTNKMGNKVKTKSFFTILFVGVLYVLVVESCIMILGKKDIQNYKYSLLEAIKLIQNPIVDRFDVLYLTVGFSGLIAGLGMIQLAMVEYACSLLPKVKRLYIVIGLFVVIMIFGILGQSVIKIDTIFNGIIPVAGLIAAFLIPNVLLLIAKVRRLDAKKN